jgi:thymidylate synthase
MKDIPVLHARGKSLAEAYENALVELYKNGGRMSTQYDKVGDPRSIDATLNITIEDPLSDPMIHKAFPGSIASLREYFFELAGYKDTWTKNINDPKDTRWEYLYSQRLRKYGMWKEKINGKSQETGFFKIDQIESIIEKLIKQPYTRQAQAITFMPNIDLNAYDMPCLQRLFYRIMEDDNGAWWLNTNVHFRSNDAWNAYFYNSFGITMFTKEFVMDEIKKRTGKEVKMARMCWMADSWHIYGKDIQQAKERLFDRISTTKFEDRVYNFYDPDIQTMYYEEDEITMKKIRDKTEEFKTTYDK